MDLYYEEYGSGDVLLFLHTGLQTGNLDFKNQIEYFSKEFRVIIPDLRGHGKSRTEDFSDYFNQCAEDVLQLIEKLSIKKCMLIGCSLGALVGVHALLKAPIYFEKVCFSGLFLNKTDKFDELEAMENENIRNLLHHEPSIQYFNAIHPNIKWQELIVQKLEMNWYPFDVIKEIPKTIVPILIIAGENAMSEVEAMYLRKDICKAMLPGGGHLIHQENPKLFNETIRYFIEA